MTPALRAQGPFGWGLKRWVVLTKTSHRSYETSEGGVYYYLVSIPAPLRILSIYLPNSISADRRHGLGGTIPFDALSCLPSPGRTP